MMIKTQKEINQMFFNLYANQPHPHQEYMFFLYIPPKLNGAFCFCTHRMLMPGYWLVGMMRGIIWKFPEPDIIRPDLFYNFNSVNIQ